VKMRTRGDRLLAGLAMVMAMGITAQAQLNPVRLNVSKVEKKDRQTTYRSADGQVPARASQFNHVLHRAAR